MTLLPSGVKIHVALGVTDMRKGLDGLAMLVQGTLKQDPFSGHLFACRGRKADTIKLLYWDGTGLCLFTKRLQRGRFIWPHITTPGGSVVLTPNSVGLPAITVPVTLNVVATAAPKPAVAANGVVNGASFKPGVTANALVTIQGTNLASTTDDWNKAIGSGQLPTSLDGVTVVFNGKPG